MEKKDGSEDSPMPQVAPQPPQTPVHVVSSIGDDVLVKVEEGSEDTPVQQVAPQTRASAASSKSDEIPAKGSPSGDKNEDSMDTPVKQEPDPQ